MAKKRILNIQSLADLSKLPEDLSLDEVLVLDGVDNSGELVSVSLKLQELLSLVPEPVLSFIGLEDTPSTFTGSENNLVKVNAAGDGLEFLDSTTYALSALSILTEANSGLSGGSTLTGDLSLAVDINSLTEEASPVDGDFFMFYDVSAGELRKLDFANISVGGFTEGSIIVADSAGELAEYNSSLFRSTDGAIGIGTNTPTLDHAGIHIVYADDAGGSATALDQAGLLIENTQSSISADQLLFATITGYSPSGGAEIKENSTGIHYTSHTTNRNLFFGYSSGHGLKVEPSGAFNGIDIFSRVFLGPDSGSGGKDRVAINSNNSYAFIGWENTNYGNSGLFINSWGATRAPLVMKTGAAPNYITANTIQVWAEDFEGTDGLASPYFKTEDEIIIGLRELYLAVEGLGNFTQFAVPVAGSTGSLEENNFYFDATQGNFVVGRASYDIGLTSNNIILGNGALNALGNTGSEQGHVAIGSNALVSLNGVTGGFYGIGIGFNAGAGYSDPGSAGSAIFIGPNTFAVGNDIINIGSNNAVIAEYGLSIGHGGSVQSDYGTLVGTQGSVGGGGDYASGFGFGVSAGQIGSSAFGALAHAGQNSAVFGYNSQAPNPFGTAVGNQTEAGYEGTTVGYLSAVTGLRSTNLGAYSTMSGSYSNILGSNLTNDLSFATVIGAEGQQHLFVNAAGHMVLGDFSSDTGLNDQITATNRDQYYDVDATSVFTILKGIAPTAGTPNAAKYFADNYQGVDGQASPMWLTEDNVLLNLREIAAGVVSGFTEGSVPVTGSAGFLEEDTDFNSLAGVLTYGYSTLVKLVDNGSGNAGGALRLYQNTDVLRAELFGGSTPTLNLIGASTTSTLTPVSLTTQTVNLNFATLGQISHGSGQNGGYLQIDEDNLGTAHVLDGSSYQDSYLAAVIGQKLAIGHTDPLQKLDLLGAMVIRRDGTFVSAAPVDGFELHAVDYNGAGTASPVGVCEDGVELDFRRMYEEALGTEDKVEFIKDSGFSDPEIPYRGQMIFANSLANSFIYNVNEIDSLGIPSVKKPDVDQTWVTANTYAIFQAWANGTTPLDETNSDLGVGETLPVPGTSEKWTLRVGAPNYDSSTVSGQRIHIIVQAVKV